MSIKFDGLGVNFLGNGVGGAPCGSTNVPATISAWVRRSDTTVAQFTCYLGVNASNNSKIFLIINPDGTIAAQTTSSAALTSAATTTAAIKDNAGWRHICGTWASSSNRVAYLDGGNKVTQGTTRVCSGANAIRVGGTTLNAGTSDGYIANVAVYNVALGDSEVFMLSQGRSPRLVRGDSLVFFLPHLGYGAGYSGGGNIGGGGGGTEIDVIKNVVMTQTLATNTGITTSSSEPPIINWKKKGRFYLMSPPAAADTLMAQVLT